MSPRAVLLDAGNTLVFVDRERVLEIYRDLGVESDEARFLAAEREARARLSRRVEDGHSGTEKHVWKEYFVTLFAASGVPAEAMEAVGERLRAEHQREHLWSRVEPGTREALEEVLDAGYRLAVISNADGRVEELIRKVGLRDLLEFVVDSEVVGFEKPDPRIFHEGTRRLGLDPGECLYVGDLYPVDVVGARGAGMSALLLDPTGELDHPVDRIPSVLELPAYLTPA
jgi:putative hydrolase of the HAD superfamily